MNVRQGKEGQLESRELESERVRDHHRNWIGSFVVAEGTEGVQRHNRLGCAEVVGWSSLAVGDIDLDPEVGRSWVARGIAGVAVAVGADNSAAAAGHNLAGLLPHLRNSLG